MSLFVKTLAALSVTSEKEARTVKSPLQPELKMETTMKLRQTITVILATLGLTIAARAQDQFLITWSATGYTHNSKGQLVATNCNARTLINKVALDNGINPNLLCFVYRVESLDTAVVFKSNGQFVADVYQMEQTYNTIANPQNTVAANQALLTQEDPNNFDGPLLNIGSIFGLMGMTYDKNGNLVNFSYHGTFSYSPLGQDVVFVGSFATGARVKITGN